MVKSIDSRDESSQFGSDLIGKLSENESDQEDHEEASFDLFSDNSDDERDDSSSDDEEGAAERDFTNVKFPEFCHYDKKYCVYNTVYHLLFGYFYKQDRIFEEVKEEDWKLFENLETFHDKPFRPEKLSHH